MKKSEENRLKRAEQRKILLTHKKKKTQQIAIFSIVLIAIVSLSSFLLITMGQDGNVDDNKSVEESTAQSKDEVAIPISEVSDVAKFYSYKSNGIDIRYFTVKGSDGDVRVAFDACDVCYHTKKGYRQIDDVMHCINCGNEYSINGLGTENTYGGCWPSYLPIDIDSDNIFIKISDLESKRYMFS